MPTIRTPDNTEIYYWGKGMIGLRVRLLRRMVQHRRADARSVRRQIRGGQRPPSRVPTESREGAWGFRILREQWQRRPALQGRRL